MVFAMTSILLAGRNAVPTWWAGIFTDAYVPFIDSFVLLLSLFAPFLLVRRLIETRPIWLAVDTID